jgi:hypothetical protein
VLKLNDGQLGLARKGKGKEKEGPWLGLIAIKCGRGNQV